MTRPSIKFSALLFGSVWIWSSGCALTHHHPKIDILGSGKAILHYEDGPLRANGLPYVEASINGVKGIFLVDTGANTPYLTKTGADRCHLFTSARVVKKVDMFYAPKAGMKEAENVTVEFGDSGVKIKWSKAIVDDREDPWFGLIDYHTLKAMHAVIDTSDKTIRISR